MLLIHVFISVLILYINSPYYFIIYTKGGDLMKFIKRGALVLGSVTVMFISLIGFSDIDKHTLNAVSIEIGETSPQDLPHEM